MSWIPRAKSSIANLGTSTVHEFLAAGCLSVVGVAFAFWRGALIAALILGVGGLLWTLSRFKRPPQTQTNDQGQTFKVRYFLIRSPGVRRIARLGGFALFVIGIGVLILTIAQGAVQIVEQGQRKAAQIDTIVDNTKAILEGQARLESQIQQIANDRTRQVRDEQSKNLALSQQLQSLTSDFDDLRVQVESALLAQAQTQLDTGKSVEEVIAGLRAGTPRDLLAFLDEQVLDDDASFERAREDLIARHRERAAIAYPLGEIAKAEHSLMRILQLVPDDLDALTRLGHLRKLQGELDEAKRLYTRVLDDAPDKSWQAVALGNLGLIEQTRGNLDAAEDYHTRSLAIETELGHKEGMAGQLGNLGVIEWTRGNLDAAQDYYTHALAINEELGSKEGMANHLGNLGLIEWTRGNLDAAEDYYTRALAINEELGRKKGMAIQLGNLGEVERIRGDLDAAQDYYTRALAINEELGRKKGMAGQLGNLGVIEWTRGNLDAAQDYYTHALAINEELGSKEGMANQLGNLGLFEQTRGNLDAAEDYHTRSLAIETELGSKAGMATSLGNLGVIEKRRGNLDGAQDYHTRALAIDEELGRKEGMANHLVNLGMIEGMRGNLLGACKLWRRSLPLYEQIGARPQAEWVRSWLAMYGCPDQPGG